jgi:hypothetical protein
MHTDTNPFPPPFPPPPLLSENFFSTPETILHIINADPQQLLAKNADEETPLRCAARLKRSLLIQTTLFARHPHNEKQFKPAAKAYMDNLRTSPPPNLNAFTPAEQNGWVELVSNSAILSDLSSEDCNLLQLSLDLIDSCPPEVAEALAKAIDFTGREAIVVADPKIKKALQSRLLFMGRYELFKGPPIHKSATCVVMKAYDDHAEDDYREKFKEFCVAKDSSTNRITKEDFKSTLLKLGVTLHDTLFEEKVRQYPIYPM